MTGPQDVSSTRSESPPPMTPLKERGEVGKMGERSLQEVVPEASSLFESEAQTIARISQERLTAPSSVPDLMGSSRPTQTKPPGQLYVEGKLIPGITLPGESKDPRPLLQRMKEMNVPGVSIAVIENGKVVWSQGYGTLDEDRHPGMVTQAASVSKVVTALTVLSLVQDGLLDLDQDVGKLFRDRLGQKGEALWKQIYPQDGPEGTCPKVSVRHLLSHTAGIPESGSEYYSIEQIDRQFIIDVHDLEREFQLPDREGYSALNQCLDELSILQKRRSESPGESVEKDISRVQKQALALLRSLVPQLPAEKISSFNERILRLDASQQCHDEAAATTIPSLDDILLGKDQKLGPVQVKDVPGEHFTYSNPGFTILQKVVEVATGRDFASVVQERVLQPLGMEKTTYTPPIETTVQGHDTDGKPLPESWRLLPHRAAGGLWTTSKELSQVVLAIQESLSDLPEKRPLGKKPPIIRRDLAEQMMSATPASKGEYGLGMFIDGKAGYFWHNGMIRGFRTLLIANGEGKGVVVLTDSQNGDALYPEIVQSVANFYKWPNGKDISICESTVRPEEKLYASASEAANPASRALWAKRTGKYEFLAEGKRYIVDARFDEHTGKLHIHQYEDKSLEGPTLTFTPLGPSVALHLPDAEGPLDVVRFTEEEGKTYLHIFGAKHAPV